MKNTDKEAIIKLQNEIEKLRSFQYKDFYVEIKLDETHWIGKGSGYISIKNYDKIKFYIDKENINYITEDNSVLNILNKIHLDLKIENLIKLKNEILAIFELYY